PKLWTVEWIHPSAFYNADEAILAFGCRFIAVASKDHNCGIAGDGWRGRASRQRDLRVPVGHQVLLDRRHVRIWRLGVLRFRLQYRSKQDDHQRDAYRCAQLDSSSFHDFS